MEEHHESKLDKDITISPVQTEDVCHQSSEQQRHNEQHVGVNLGQYASFSSLTIQDLDERVSRLERLVDRSYTGFELINNVIKRLCEEVTELKQQIQELRTETGSAEKVQEEPRPEAGPEPESEAKLEASQINPESGPETVECSNEQKPQKKKKKKKKGILNRFFKFLFCTSKGDLPVDP